MERITTDMIAEKEFSIESKGYNKEEVDTFLDLICEEMDRLNNEIQDLHQKTTIVRNPAPAAEPSGISREDENKFREILEMAATVKEETIRKAREDAEAIRLKAETEAGERLNGLAEERAALEAAGDPAEWDRLFGRIWTRKESYLKATGRGLSHAMAEFSVMSGPEEAWFDEKDLAEGYCFCCCVLGGPEPSFTWQVETLT